MGDNFINSILNINQTNSTDLLYGDIYRLIFTNEFKMKLINFNFKSRTKIKTTNIEKLGEKMLKDKRFSSAMILIP